MGKISPAQKAEFAEKSNGLKQDIDDLNKKVQIIQKEMTKESGNVLSYKKILISNIYMNIISIYLKLSGLSMAVLGIRNETYLENARKLCYKFLALLEEIVGNYIDVPFTEQTKQLESISQIDDVKRLKLIKKITNSVNQVEERFGPNSKWKWSFVDMDARAVTLCKNLTDFKRIQANQDPRIEGFPERNELLTFIKEYLRKAADRLREKYEVASHDTGEMKNAIRYLSSLMRISILFSDGEESNNLKKNIKIWEEKLEQDMKNLDEKKKKKSARR
ncbi:MAG: hypothetical protein KKH98_06915 [Spirochaetes bacterium]|nr:hypothetical protein [Spirochaetota bacterium]